MVYYKGPDRYHASMSVRVKGQDLSKLDQEQDEEITQFSALVRINETASKVKSSIFVRCSVKM